MQVLNLTEDVQFSTDVKKAEDKSHMCADNKTASAQYTERLVDKRVVLLWNFLIWG